MIIITKSIKNITKYIKLGKANVFSVKYGCENCGYQGRLHRHGFYSRNVITCFSFHRISILRVKCPSCNKTYSLLPPFLIPYYQYSFDVIFLCLYISYVQKQSYQNIINYLHGLNPDLLLGISRISYYKKRMEKIIPLTNSFFANFQDYYYEMNDPTPVSLLKKIKYFRENPGNFNYTYFQTIPHYFFSPVKDDS